MFRTRLLPFFLLLLGPALLAAEPHQESALTGPSAHWSYQGADGPQQWGRLSPAYQACSQGKNQSPIDIRWSAESELDNLNWQYSSTEAQILNNGHTIQVNFNPGNRLQVGGKTYELLQFHFHHQSEHLIQGKSSPMELHLVHKSAAGELAVLGVMLKQGAQNQALSQVFANLPRQAGPAQALGSALNPASLLPAQRGYFHYMGSLTTPPCSENVKWFVLKAPIEASAAQIKAFADLFANNYRPAQVLNRRGIFAHNP